ncbi:MAG: NEW3 domain-containing protein [Candidatus Glassbacteria bacterium]
MTVRLPLIFFSLLFISLIIQKPFILSYPHSSQETEELERTRDERYRLLELKKAYVKLMDAKTRFQRAKELLEKELISREKYNEIETEYLTAEVEYSQKYLDLAYEKPHIMIKNAIKYQDEKGEKRVKITLQNTMGGAFKLEEIKMLEDDVITRHIKLYELQNVFVSLKVDGTIISQPYEQKISVMKYGVPVTLDFGLLRDVNEAVVSLSYYDKLVERKVYLEKDITANVVTLTSSKFSQEADLGHSATYDLKLERFTDEENTFGLEVFNLPPQIHYEFSDPETGARLTQVKFTEGVTIQNLNLTLYLGERVDEEVKVDTPIDFYAMVLDAEVQKEIAGKDKNNLTEEEIKSLRAGKVSLKLIPRGVGEIEVDAANLYHEIAPGQKVRMKISLKNIGTRRLDNILVKAETPFEWSSTLKPEVIKVLEPNKETPVQAVFEPPRDIEVGDYVVRLKTEATSNNRLIKAEDKRVRIHVKPASSILFSVTLLLALFALVAGVVIFGLRIAKR